MKQFDLDRSVYELFEKSHKMDEMFEHFHKVFDDMAFSGFFTRKSRSQSPRDEMLRQPEDESNSSTLPVPEPWMLFPFYGDLVKPDMMNRDLFNETLLQRDPLDFEKRDIIIDDQSARAPFTENSHPSVHTWISSFTSRKIIGNNGEMKELQKRVVREPDGTEVHTTIERSSDGEKKHVIYKRPDGQQLDVMNNEGIQIMEPLVSPMKEHQSERPSGIFGALRRWFYGN
uniref:HCLS1-associated protein X-1 n=2 Tax=Schistosoma japonicum TaxID=6182 RepID=C1L871_SCHJA|nr:hypothetical protein [Schistosoma japonicum]CAX70899.1 hypothetical protein [Schistosoma japonicum]CAX76040.1 hypothetical protein [Schistosoma japonicum]CAX76041.1 hypothetical protein [Schistosoma japonicum]CAX76042.1 hypothetical protein [Schistosoma japonicum]